MEEKDKKPLHCSRLLAKNNECFLQLNRVDGIVKRLSKLSYVTAIFLFGSQANGRARKDSDIDIAVLTKRISREKELEIIGFGDDMIDISIFHRLPLVIQFRVLKEGKILFLKDYKYIYDVKVNVFRHYWDYSVFINKFYKRVIKNV